MNQVEFFQVVILGLAFVAVTGPPFWYCHKKYIKTMKRLIQIIEQIMEVLATNDKTNKQIMEILAANDKLNKKIVAQLMINDETNEQDERH